jgi:hypothetical protein
MNATLAYFTNRRNPRFAWFCDALVRQIPADELKQMQIVFVDALLWDVEPQPVSKESVLLGLADLHSHERRQQLAEAVAGRFEYQHLPPKPCVWQGPWRQTDADGFAASNARNTAIIVAEKPYLVCVDDLSVLAPGWADNVRHAAQNGYVVCGSYQKLRAMEVKDGELLGCDIGYRGGIDSRWDRGSATGIVPWSGAGLFGCSFGVPVDLAVKVDGFDAHCDGQGAEDYDFGIRLERAGGKFFYNRNMLTYESEEAHTEDQPATGADKPRLAKHVPPDRLPECLKASYPDGLMSDHVMLQALIHEPGRFLPLGTNGIAELRAQWQRERTRPTPIGRAVDWRTGELLAAEDVERWGDEDPALAMNQPSDSLVELQRLAVEDPIEPQAPLEPSAPVSTTEPVSAAIADKPKAAGKKPGKPGKPAKPAKKAAAEEAVEL